MKDDQVKSLMKLLQKKRIWALNIGENYEIKNTTWQEFTDFLPKTFVTHLYVSEHVISLDMKNKMRDNIRSNRKKITLHCAMKNLSVIERVTNMWW